MVRFEIGDVILSEGNHNALISRWIMAVTGSKYTHCFIVTGEDRITEAWITTGVRHYGLSQRLEELEKDGRKYVTLRYPNLTSAQKLAIVGATESFLGRRYDPLQALWFGVFRTFFRDGPKRVVCSRLVTAVYQEMLGIDLFPWDHLLMLDALNYPRLTQLRAGYVTPHELLDYSTLEAVHPESSERAFIVLPDNTLSPMMKLGV